MSLPGTILYAVSFARIRSKVKREILVRTQILAEQLAQEGFLTQQVRVEPRDICIFTETGSPISADFSPYVTGFAV